MEGDLQSKAGGKEFLPNSKQRAIQGVKMLQSGDTEWCLPTLELKPAGTPYHLPHRLCRQHQDSHSDRCWNGCVGLALETQILGFTGPYLIREICRAHFTGVSVLKVSPQAVKDGRNHQGTWGKESTSTGILLPGSWQPWSEQPSTQWALILIMLFFTNIQEIKQIKQKQNKASWTKILESMSQNNSLFS